jgi:opacity protein-like surface antigen
MRSSATVLSFFLVTVLLAGANAASAQTPAPAPTPAPRTWKASINGQHGELSGDHTDEGQYTFALEKTLNSRAKLSASVDQHNRFDELDTQLIVGGQYGWPTGRSLLAATFTEGFGAEQAAQRGIDTKFSWQAHAKVRPLVEVAYSLYSEDKFLTMYTAGVDLIPNAKLQAEITVMQSDASDDKGGTAGTGGISYTVNDRWTITLGGGYGHEHFLAKAVEEVKRELTALQLVGGVVRSLPHHNSIKVEWEYQDRKTAYSTNLLTVAWSRSF